MTYYYNVKNSTLDQRLSKPIFFYQQIVYVSIISASEPHLYFTQVELRGPVYEKKQCQRDMYLCTYYVYLILNYNNNGR